MGIPTEHPARLKTTEIDKIYIGEDKTNREKKICIEILLVENPRIRLSCRYNINKITRFHAPITFKSKHINKTECLQDAR